MSVLPNQMSISSIGFETDFMYNRNKEAKSMTQERITEAMRRARIFIDNLTLDAPNADPKAIIEDEDRFFAWDNEHRSPKTGKTFLFDWSYYIGIVMEGLYYMYEAGEGEKYKAYVQRYLRALEEDGRLNKYAGYEIGHGVDCYKTASLLPAFMGEDECLTRLADNLYYDLAVVNSAYAPASLGGNYYHVWRDGKPPKYAVWLDGLYMSQCFLARYAAKKGDKEALKKVAGRFYWVNENLKDEKTGLFFHAGNKKGDACEFFWLRAIGWYAMAQVDVCECLTGEDRESFKAALNAFVNAMLPFRDAETGMWNNLVNEKTGNGNRAETSGSVMMAYTLMKGARLGLLPAEMAEIGREIFTRITEQKLIGTALTDVYLMAAASGEDNYRKENYYMLQEGKGVGPYIMAYAEMLKAK